MPLEQGVNTLKGPSIIRVANQDQSAFRANSAFLLKSKFSSHIPRMPRLTSLSAGARFLADRVTLHVDPSVALPRRWYASALVLEYPYSVTRGVRSTSPRRRFLRTCSSLKLSLSRLHPYWQRFLRSLVAVTPARS